MIKEKQILPLTLLVLFLTLVGLVLSYILAEKSQGTEQIASDSEAVYMEKVFDKEKLLEINIEVDETLWEELLANAQEEQYVAANLTINGETISSVGIRAKGNSSLSMVAADRTTDRYSFKIKFDEYIEGQSFYGLDKMVLNNGLGDATYMKEYLAYDLYNAMGIATPGFAFAKVNVNGEAWGVYLAVESMEESFIERHYGDLDGNLYKVESANLGGKQEGIPNWPGGMNPPEMPFNGQAGDRAQEGMPNWPEGMNPPEAFMNGQAGDREQEGRPNWPEAMNSPEGMPNGPFGGDMGASTGTNLVYKDDEIASYPGIFDNTVLKKTTKADQQKIIEMMKNLSEGNELERYLDVEEVLKYFAINTFLVNLDSYASNMKHNFYLYEEGGKVQILPWDYNLAFAGYGSLNATQAINFPIDKPVTDSMENSPLIAKLLEVESYKEKYHDYLNQIVVEYVESGRYEAIIKQVDALINEAVKGDVTAFYTHEEYEAALPELIQFGKNRAASIRAQLAGEQPSETYGTLTTTVNLSRLGSMGGGKGGPQERQQEGQEVTPLEGTADKEVKWPDKLSQQGRPNGQPLQGFNANRPSDENRRGPNGMNSLEQVTLSSQQKDIFVATGGAVVGGILLILCFKRRKYRS